MSTMTVKEVAEALGVTDRTVRRHAEAMGLTQNGVTTFLNEQEVTKIKLMVERSGRNDLDNVVQLPKTSLEKHLIVAQALQIQNEMIAELQQQLAIAAPKVEAHDALIKTNADMSITDAGKHFGARQSELFSILRTVGPYLTTHNLPTQYAIDMNVLSLKETIGHDGRAHKQAVVKASQLDNLRRLYDRHARRAALTA